MTMKTAPRTARWSRSRCGLRERNQFPAEKKSDHRAAEKNEGVRHEPELVGRLRFDLGLAASLRQRFAHLCFSGKFRDGFGHHYGIETTVPDERPSG